jgi:CheY-like chemotaxis protein/HPt (histidine-containing phosphotransfer) domain-containing protein
MEADPFRAILLDTGIAGKNGASLFNDLRKHLDSEAQVILMFPSADSARDMASSSKWGVANHIIKPIVQSELLHSLGNAVAPAPRTGIAVGSEEPCMSRRPLRVLLAEDNEVNRDLAVALLQGMGHTVTVASDGYAVLKAVGECTFDVLLMDLQMPRLDGLQATRAIRRHEQKMRGAQARRLPIVAVTAHALSTDRDACLSAGMDEYVTKPIRKRELMAALDHLFPPVRGGDVASRRTALDSRALIDQVNGDTSLLKRLAAVYFEHTPALLHSIRTASAAGEMQDLVRTAHTLKGSLVQLSALAPVDIAVRLETAARRGDAAAVRNAAAELEAGVEDFDAALRAFLTTLN